MKSERDGKKQQVVLIADGTKMIALVEGAPHKLAGEVPKWLGEASRSGFARTGVGLASFEALVDDMDRIKEFKADEHFGIVDFKLGKKEMVNQQEAQVVQYTLTLKTSAQERKVAVSAWIDTKTQLPLKRVSTEWEWDIKITVTEMYSNVAVDGKIDPKQFEVPKK
jgi:outer membrane lipoprotein-sorting protein